MTDTANNSVSNGRTGHRPRQMTRGRRILFAIAAPIIAGFLKLAWSTYRFRLEQDEKFLELVGAGQPMVFAIWHEGLLTVGWYVAQLLRRGVPVTFLISPSTDGELGVQILARFGSRAVRGSARRSGAAALRGLKQAITRAGQAPVIAVDGSKGPRRYCKPGAIMVARMAGVPVVPIGFAASRAWRARSWDRHLVPYPGSEVAITVGEPLVVERQMDSDAVEACRGKLEQRIKDLMEISGERIGVRTGA
jgi:lysophospholipid acyltransferase (LPLAT)-like uncharacterized protein